MRFWFDTEFIDDGKTIELISIGAIAQDGRTYYAEASECDLTRASPWVRKNVVPYLNWNARKTRSQIAKDLVKFFGESPEIWAYFAAYDWVVLCQLFGPMVTHLPKSWPMFPLDLQQLRYMVRCPALPPHTGQAHNALDDAIWTRDAWFWLTSQKVFDAP